MVLHYWILEFISNSYIRVMQNFESAFNRCFSLVPFKCVPQALFLTCSPHSPANVFSDIYLIFYFNPEKNIW